MDKCVVQPAEAMEVVYTSGITPTIFWKGYMGPDEPHAMLKDEFIRNNP